MPVQTVHLTNVTCPITAPQPYSSPPQPGKGPSGLGAGHNAPAHRPTLNQDRLASPGSLWGAGRGPSSHRQSWQLSKVRTTHSLSTRLNPPVRPPHTRRPPWALPLHASIPIHTPFPTHRRSELWSRPCPRATSQDQATGLLGLPHPPPSPSPSARVELSVPRTSRGLPRARRLPRALLGVQVLLTELRVPTLLSAGGRGVTGDQGRVCSVLNSGKTRGRSSQRCLGPSPLRSAPRAAPPSVPSCQHRLQLAYHTRTHTHLTPPGSDPWC